MPSTEATTIILSEVSKTYDDAIALHPINLSIPSGQTTVLIGPSGCGKSTTLRIIIGLIKSDRGDVVFENKKVTAKNIHKLRHRMGYVIQNGGLFPHLTAKRNITLMSSYLKWSQEQIENRLHNLLNLTQFPEAGLDRFPAQLSGGQQQRVALMRALMLNPDVLLLDEPLGALDPMIRADLQTELKQIFQKLHKTTLMVTHDLSEAAYFGDQIVLMKSGRIIQQGKIDELVNKPSDPFVTQFIQAQTRTIQAIKGEKA